VRTLFHSEYETLSRKASLVVFAVVVFFFLVLAVRTEVNGNRIEKNTHDLVVQQWQSCVGGTEILKKFNDQQRKLAAVERTQKLDRKLRDRRIAIYEGAIVPVRDCGPKPR
jgi:hypothetical protein